MLQRRPALLRLVEVACGIGGKGVTVGLLPKQIEPFARDHPKQRIAGNGDAARDVDRVVTAVFRAVNFRMGQEGGAVAFVVEAPDRAALPGLEVRQTQHGLAIDKIGDRVVAVDGKPGEAVDDQPFRGRPIGCEVGEGRPKARQSRNKGYSETPAVRFLPQWRR